MEMKSKRLECIFVLSFCWLASFPFLSLARAWRRLELYTHTRTHSRFPEPPTHTKLLIADCSTAVPMALAPRSSCFCFHSMSIVPSFLRPLCSLIPASRRSFSLLKYHTVRSPIPVSRRSISLLKYYTCTSSPTASALSAASIPVSLHLRFKHIPMKQR